MTAISMKTSTLASLLGAAALALVSTASYAADGPVPMKAAMEKCYGVAKAAKNDCAAGAHSCAGQATKDFDKTSYLQVPIGVCGKLAGGSLTAMAK